MLPLAELSLELLRHFRLLGGPIPLLAGVGHQVVENRLSPPGEDQLEAVFDDRRLAPEVFLPGGGVAEVLELDSWIFDGGGGSLLASGVEPGTIFPLPAGVVLSEGDRFWPLLHLPFQEGAEADSVQGSLRRGNPQEVEDGGQDIRGDTADGGAPGLW